MLIDRVVLEIVPLSLMISVKDGRPTILGIFEIGQALKPSSIQGSHWPTSRCRHGDGGHVDVMVQLFWEWGRKLVTRSLDSLCKIVWYRLKGV